MILNFIIAEDSFALFSPQHLNLNSYKLSGCYFLLAHIWQFSFCLATTNNPVINHVHHPPLETAFLLHRGRRWQTNDFPVCNGVISISRPQQIRANCPLILLAKLMKIFPHVSHLVGVQPAGFRQVCENSLCCVSVNPLFFSNNTCTNMNMCKCTCTFDTRRSGPDLLSHTVEEQTFWSPHWLAISYFWSKS